MVENTSRFTPLIQVVTSIEATLCLGKHLVRLGVMVNKCSTSTEQKSRAQKISEAEGRAVKMARRVGGGLAALPLKYSSNFFVKRP